MALLLKITLTGFGDSEWQHLRQETFHDGAFGSNAAGDFCVELTSSLPVIAALRFAVKLNMQ